MLLINARSRQIQLSLYFFLASMSHLKWAGHPYLQPSRERERENKIVRYIFILCNGTYNICTYMQYRYTKHFKWGDLWKWYKQSPISTWTKQVSRSTWCRIFKTDSNIWRFKTSMYELIFFVFVKHMKLKWISWTCDVHRNLWILAKIVCELHCHIILFFLFFLSQQLGNNLFKFWPTLFRSINCCVSGERCRLQGSFKVPFARQIIQREHSGLKSVLTF